MSYSHWIILFLFFGFISYSYEFNVRNNHKQRRVRESELRDNTQDIANAVVKNTDNMGNQVKNSTRQDEDALELITKKVMEAVYRMVKAGSQDISNALQWTAAQNELREGIRIVIKSYRNYIELHQKLCDGIENFAKDMISKYEEELSLIDQMNAPTSQTSGRIDTNSDDWIEFKSRLEKMREYMKLHGLTLKTAYSYPQDMTNSAKIYYTRTVPVGLQYIPPTVGVQYTQYSPTVTEDDCNYVNGYNSAPGCSHFLVKQTQALAGQACGCMYGGSK